MYIVTESTLHRFPGDGNKYITEIRADSASDLPTLTEEPSMAMGSIAYAIDEGKFYMLNSSGEWVAQGDENAAVTSVSPQVQTLAIDRVAMQPVTDDTASPVTVQEPDEPDVMSPDEER